MYSWFHNLLRGLEKQLRVGLRKFRIKKRGLGFSILILSNQRPGLEECAEAV